MLAELGAEEATTVVALTTNSEVNALATHLAHDAFGVERTFPALDHPSRGAGPRLLEQVGGRVAFGRPIDVRAWDAALDEGTADFVTWRVPPGGPTRAAQLPESVVPLVRVQGDLTEVVSADLTWRAGDELVLLQSPARERDGDDAGSRRDAKPGRAGKRRVGVSLAVRCPERITSSRPCLTKSYARRTRKKTLLDAVPSLGSISPRIAARSTTGRPCRMVVVGNVAVESCDEVTVRLMTSGVGKVSLSSIWIV